MTVPVTTALRLHLLLLLTLPALLVPRGLELGWCLCSVAERAGCCAHVEEAPARSTGCCAVEDHDSTPRAESRGALDCPGCRSIELEDFEEFLVTPAAPELPTPALVTGGAERETAVTVASRAFRAPLRAPPGAVRPPGLLPGTAPLRI